MLSLDDPLLPSKFLKHTLSAYQGKISQVNPNLNGNQYDLMSPELTDSATLAQYPQTLIQVSQNDPIRDFGILFAVKLKKLGVNVELKEYSDAPHGLLNLNSNIFELKHLSRHMIKECSVFM